MNKIINYQPRYPVITSTNSHAFRLSANIIMTAVALSLWVLSILIHSSQFESTPDTVSITHYLSSFIAVLISMLMFWRFIQQRQRLFLYLCVGFFWVGVDSVLWYCVQLATKYISPHIGVESLATSPHAEWFVLSVLIVISTRTGSKTIHVEPLTRCVFTTAILTALMICVLNLATAIVWPTGSETVQPFLRLDRIGYTCALPFFLAAGILYFRTYVRDRYHLLAWFAGASFILALSCLISTISIISNRLSFIDLLIRFMGFSGFIFGLFAEKNLFFETEIKLRTSLERSLVELERNEAEWQAMVENAQVAIVVIDTHGKIVRCNPAVADVFNQSSEQLVGQKIESCVQSRFRESFRIEMQKWLQGHNSEFEAELIGPGDKGLPVFVNAVSQYSSNGKVNGAYMTLVPIGLWKTSESKLREDLAKSEKLLRTEKEKFSNYEREWQAEKQAYSSFLRNSSEIMLLLNERGTCIFINRYGQELTGFSAKKLQRNTLPTFLRDVNQFQHQFGTSVDLTLSDYEEKWRIQNGKTILIRWNAKLLTDTQGKRLGIIAVGRDITHQRELEQRLYNYNHRLEEIVREHTVDFDHRIDVLSHTLSILTSDSMKNDLNTKLECLCKAVCETGSRLAVARFHDIYKGNSCWAAALRIRKMITSIPVARIRIWNFEPQSNVGKQISRSYFYTSEDIPHSMHKLHSRLLARVPNSQHDLELTNLVVVPLMLQQTSWGNVFAFNINAENSAIQATVRLLETLAMATASAIYNHLLQIENNKRIVTFEKERISRLKFLSHVSHELRTPLNTILSLLEMVVRHHNANLTVEQQKQLRTMEQAGEQMLGQVNNILDFVSIESDKKDSVPTYITISEFLQSRVEAIRPLAADKSIKIGAKVYKNIPEGVFVDEESLSCVIENLLSNAVKFTKKGEIDLLARSKQGGKALEVSVKDTGVGIPDAKLKDIFSEFKRLRQTTAKGTGLGLPIVKKTLERLGGEITVESQENKGSIFRMVFPLRKVGEVYMLGLSPSGRKRVITPSKPVSKKQASPSISEEERKSKVTSQSKTFKSSILVIDDDINTHTALRFLFEERGYGVRFAANGMEGLGIARQKKPDLIFMDLTMPNMDGFETTRKLKTTRSLKNVPVIAMTGKPEAEWSKARQAGCVDWLSKPFRAQELEKKLHQWLPEKHR